jgi:uncharacterized membrane protein
MIRQTQRRRAEAQRSIDSMTRLRRIAFVVTYMSFIHIWGYENTDIGFHERFNLTLFLVGSDQKIIAKRGSEGGISALVNQG